MAPQPASPPTPTPPPRPATRRTPPPAGTCYFKRGVPVRRGRPPGFGRRPAIGSFELPLARSLGLPARSALPPPREAGSPGASRHGACSGISSSGPGAAAAAAAFAFGAEFNNPASERASERGGKKAENVRHLPSAPGRALIHSSLFMNYS